MQFPPCIASVLWIDYIFFHISSLVTLECKQEHTLESVILAHIEHSYVNNQMMMPKITCLKLKGSPPIYIRRHKKSFTFLKQNKKFIS